MPCGQETVAGCDDRPGSHLVDPVVRPEVPRDDAQPSAAPLLFIKQVLCHLEILNSHRWMAANEVSHYFMSFP